MDLKHIKCVAFDADNTLYSTKKVAHEADMAAMRALADLTGKTPEELYQKFLIAVSLVKDSPNPKIRHRKYSYGKLCAGCGEGALDKMYEEFEKVVLGKLEIVPGVAELLEKLSGKELYVITEDNRDMALKKLEQLKILKYFKGVITSDDVGTMKPSKHFYSELISRFKPAEILVLGDKYEKDLAIPEKMGMKVLLVDQPEKISEFESIIKQS